VVAVHHTQDNRRTTIGAWREEMKHPYLFNMAVHFFDLIRYLSGAEAVSISAKMYRPEWSMYAGLAAMDSDITLTDNVHARLNGSFVGRGFETLQEGLITVVGTEGTVRLDEMGKVRLYDKNKTVSDVPILEAPEGDCDTSFSEFLAVVGGQAKPSTGLSDNLKTFAMVIAAQRSNDENRRVETREIVS
jgi:predicted dehydrogenase